MNNKKALLIISLLIIVFSLVACSNSVSDNTMASFLVPNNADGSIYQFDTIDGDPFYQYSDFKSPEKTELEIKTQTTVYSVTFQSIVERSYGNCLYKYTSESGEVFLLDSHNRIFEYYKKVPVELNGPTTELTAEEIIGISNKAVEDFFGEEILNHYELKSQPDLSSHIINLDYKFKAPDQCDDYSLFYNILVSISADGTVQSIISYQYDTFIDFEIPEYFNDEYFTNICKQYVVNSECEIEIKSPKQFVVINNDIITCVVFFRVIGQDNYQSVFIPVKQIK